MEAAVNNGICRCCASDGTCKDVKSTYHWMGEEEIYSDMLRDCFDISLIQSEYDDGGICEVCITQLRNASNFKKQVLHTEKQFELRIQGKLFKSDIVKIEPSKVDNEANDSDNYLSEEFSCGGEDFEVPIKIETDDVKPKKRAAAAKASTSRAKKAKANDGETSTKRIQRVIIKTEIEDKETKVKIEGDVKKETVRSIIRRSKGQELEKHRNTIREILLCTNATPIRSRGGIGYVCCFCSDQYPDAADLKRHTIDQHDETTKASFMKGKDLSKFAVKLDITSLHCNLCSDDIDTIEKLIDHLQEHKKNVFVDSKNQIVPFKFDGGENLRCAICSNVFHTFRGLVEHMNIHYRNHVCKFCDAGFVSQAILFQHVKTHKTGSFKCDYCAKVFETLIKKRSHERVVHTHTNVLNKCGYCVETFKDYWQRLKHLATVHGVHAPVFKCQACDKSFPQQKSLRIHTKRDHLMERPHACQQCDMKFFTAKKLTEHMVKHTGLREFQCQVCLKSYGRKKTLNQHMRVHDEFCRFKCEHCNQGFVQRNSWIGHLRTKHGQQV